MNCPRMIASVFLAGLTLRASELRPTAQHNAQKDVKICMEVGAAPPWVVVQAKSFAAKMFADIGVGIEWYYDRRHCHVPPEEFLVVLLSTGAPDGELPDALAYSRLADRVHIEVFYNRVAKMVDPSQVPNVLAHVLVHEIAHMLEGINRHSTEGVMKAHWDARDFLQMSGRALNFAPEDVELIQRGLAQRETMTRCLCTPTNSPSAVRPAIR